MSKWESLRKNLNELIEKCGQSEAHKTAMVYSHVLELMDEHEDQEDSPINSVVH